MNKWIHIKCQIKSKLNSRKFKGRQMSYTLNMIHLQYENQRNELEFERTIFLDRGNELLIRERIAQIVI